MSARTWTTEQLQAIEARGGSVLVSAAAGSGKTAVLVERVIRMICDKDHPCPLDRLLVVTFTRAAAAEMRERIGKALADRLAADPFDGYLLHQQMSLPSAEICTMDSFCSALVKRCFHELDISPDFQMLSDSERRALEEETLTECLKPLYASDNNTFRQLSELFLLGSSDRLLKDTVLELYRYAQAYPFPEKWLADIVQAYDAQVPVAESPWGKAILSYIDAQVSENIRILEKGMTLLSDEEGLYAAYAPAMQSDLKTGQAILQAVRAGDWDCAKAQIERYTPERFKSAPREYRDSEIKATVAALRDKAKKSLMGLLDVMPATEAEHREDMRFLKPIVSLLVQTVLDFSAALYAAKREANAFDFNDISHMTLRLLVHADENGVPQRTEIAKELSEKYNEILLDEYQDTNEAQDMLFSAISRDGGNLFTVGDVKQSIYGFRLAMPEIFIHRRASYQDFDGKTYPARITLDRNFRSRKNIADGINYIFGQLMTEECGGVAYNGTERLCAAADFDASSDPPIELHLLQENADGDSPEYEYIAALIRELIDSNTLVKDKTGQARPIRYGDICILMRSLTGAERYQAALERAGVPAFYQKKGGFFSMTEIRVMTSLLQILSNPLLEVPLCACLLSPIWGFSPDELAKIKMRSHEENLFRKLRDTDTPKCRAFLEDYLELRHLSAVLPPDELLRTIYEKTGFPAIVGAMRGGENRKLNLLLLQHYAEEYAANSPGGLSGFLRKLERLRENEENVEAATGVSEYADVVRIMSIHKSKGLEFPVVILAKCASAFNRKDQTKRMLIHPQMKLGLRVLEGKNERQCVSVPYVGTKLAIASDAQAEELRVLYVALTRAKERLILVGSGSANRKAEKMLEKAALAVLGEKGVGTMAVREANGYMDWLLASLIKHPQAEELRRIAGIGERESTVGGFSLLATVSESTSDLLPEQTEASSELPPPDETLLQMIDARVHYRYRGAKLAACPAKMTASQLNAAEQSFDFFAETRPAFLGKGGLTPAMRGTATHRFAELCDFAAAQKDLEGEIARLTRDGHFTETEADALDRSALIAFLRSDLLRRMQNAERLCREQKFTVFFPARDLYADLDEEDSREQIMVQGMIDCAFLEKGKWVIVDYKTDRVQDEAELSERYKRQLAVYKRAAEELFETSKVETELYSFALQKEIVLVAL